MGVIRQFPHYGEYTEEGLDLDILHNSLIIENYLDYTTLPWK